MNITSERSQYLVNCSKLPQPGCGARILFRSLTSSGCRPEKIGARLQREPAAIRW